MTASASPSPESPITTVVFDLGGVLIDWDPRYLYRQLLATDEAIEAFLDEVGFSGWNHTVDAGTTTWTDAVAALTAAHPHHRELIEAYPLRFAETLSGPIEDSVAVLRELDELGLRLLGLTNWSAETFPVALERFDFLALFDDIMVSGAERVAKPDPEIFALLVGRHGLDPARTLFVDDKQANVEAAARAGLIGLRFLDAATLRADLEAAGVLRPRP
ncbi:MAG: HAD family phosphatase [Spirochaetaceae bacterium]|nr:HAD family phosphatase [Spirochaetaceae bacterium]